MSQLLNSHVVPSLGLAAGARVVVAMSGGVDSSVVAALLVHQGYDVIGITLQLYDHGAATARKGACCAGQDIHDARRVAERLGIPHYVLDYEQRFADRVIGAFADAYAAGETPVPCITCNQQIKFTDLLETARDLGAAALATGHYVAREDGPGGPWLRRAVDADRDQSYFLFGTTREQLAMLRFPLGHLTKARVRGLAAELALPVATKPDSQDICFVPSGHYSALIERLRPSACEPGDIVHIDGRVLGRHDGVIRYTVGQRRGLGLSGHHSSVQTGGQASAGPDGSIEPLFVVRLDAARRRVIVGPRSALRTRAIILKNMNWLGGDTPGTNAPTLGEGLECFARVRSTQAPRPARLWLGRMRDDRQPSSRKFGDATPTVEAHVELLGVEHGVSPGQACVLYADGTAEARLLGGGIIAATDVSIALAPLRA